MEINYINTKIDKHPEFDSTSKKTVTQNKN
jgi:hypothetical protein